MTKGTSRVYYRDKGGRRVHEDPRTSILSCRKQRVKRVLFQKRPKEVKRGCRGVKGISSMVD